MDKETIEKARRHVAEMDEIDRESGFARPGQCGITSLIRTAMLAIEADCHADAYVYLEQSLRHIEQSPAP